MTSKTKVPAVPSPTDQNLRDVARAIKGILDVREGLSGDPLDRFVTLRELVDGGVATTTGAGRSVVPSAIPTITQEELAAVVGYEKYDPTADATIPPVPQGFTAVGLFAAIRLDWVAPQIRNYAYTEIWRADTNVLGSAIRIGTSNGTSFTDYLGSGVTRFYWIRFVSQANVIGPYNSSSGTSVATSQDPAFLLQVLTNQITESQLYSTLGNRINLIDAPSTGLVTQVSNLNGQYTVKIDNNGYVTGFGLASTEVNGTPTSQFIVRADRFVVASPTGPGITPVVPFSVQTTSSVGSNGVTIPAGVYINDAYIKNASINAAKIGSVYADRINAGFTSSVDLESSVFYGSELYLGGTVTYEYNDPQRPSQKTGIGFVSNPNIALKNTGAEFNVNYFKVKNGTNLYTPFEVANGVVRIAVALIGDGTITTAKIADVIQSTNYITGQSGWRITKAGTIELQDAIVRGDVQATSLNAATGTFTGTLTSVDGTFTGVLRGATGDFGGVLTAGTVDISKLVGQSTTYAVPGTYYITVPADFTSCRVTLIGAGGGGATGSVGSSSSTSICAGPGGGGGGVSIATFSSLTPGTQIVLTVGAGGAGGAGRSGNGYLPDSPQLNGGNGGNTSVSGAVNLTAYGGKGGTTGYQNGSGAVAGAGGYGTTASGSDGLIYGPSDIPPPDNQLFDIYVGGSGGNSGLNYGLGGVNPGGLLGSWYATGDFSQSGGTSGKVYGGGGSGADWTGNGVGSLGGGNGANGKAIIEFFNPNGVVIRNEWNVLISALQRQGIQTT